MLAKNRGFTAVAVLTLALGIGGTTAMFSLINGVLLRPLPFPHPEQLMAVMGLTYPSEIDPLAWWGHNQAFDQLANCDSGGVNLSGAGRAERISAAVVSATFFPVLQVQPMLGRGFLADEERPGRNRVAILSYQLWAGEFGGDRGLLGRSIRLNGIPHTIVGVTPAGFSFPGQTSIWVPRVPDVFGGGSLDLGENVGLIPGESWDFGRLRPRVTPQEASALLTTLAHRLQEKYGSENRIVANKFIRVLPLQERMVRDSRRALLVLFGAVLFVLLIVCANVASMLLARAVVRQKEVAVRLCVGANKFRIMRQLLTESLLLTTLGGALGVLISLWGVEGIRAISPSDLPRLASVHVDPVVLGFALIVSVMTAIVVGLAPAFQTLKPDLTQALKEEGLRSIGGLGDRMRATLVVGEVALALVLLTGAGVLIRSFARLAGIKPGFDPQNVLTMELALPAARYWGQGNAKGPSSVAQTQERKAARPGSVRRESKNEAAGQEQSIGRMEGSRIVGFHQRLEQTLKGLPGVVAVGATTCLPLSGCGGYLYFDIGGKMVPCEGGEGADVSYVSGEYFQAIGIPLLAGRNFTGRDNRDTPKVVIINRIFARSIWGDKSPIGQQFIVEGEEPYPREIVGVVGDAKIAGLGKAPECQMYFPYTQPYRQAQTEEERLPLDMNWVVRSAVDLNALVAQIPGRVASVDSDLPVFHVRTMDEVISGSVAPERFRGLLLGIFSSLAFFLAVLGVYGVVSYSVTCRTHELGVRMSIGARPVDIVLLVFKQGIALALWGVGLGLIGAFGLDKLVAGFLFGVRPADPLTFTVGALLLLGGVLLASALPARRAAKVDPLVALRYE
jgi:putative ABC transport system permease protein